MIRIRNRKSQRVFRNGEGSAFVERECAEDISLQFCPDLAGWRSQRKGCGTTQNIRINPVEAVDIHRNLNQSLAGHSSWVTLGPCCWWSTGWRSSYIILQIRMEHRASCWSLITNSEHQGGTALCILLFWQMNAKINPNVNVNYWAASFMARWLNKPFVDSADMSGKAISRNITWRVVTAGAESIAWCKKKRLGWCMLL